MAHFALSMLMCLVSVLHQHCVPKGGHRRFNIGRILAHYLDVLENRILLGLMYLVRSEAFVLEYHLPTRWAAIGRRFCGSSVLEPTFGAGPT